MTGKEGATMSDVTIQRGALRMTIKGASPMLVTKGNALIVTGKCAPIAKVSQKPTLRLVQKAS
jgi:hypothetical protein